MSRVRSKLRQTAALKAAGAAQRLKWTLLAIDLASDDERVTMNNSRTALVTGATKGIGFALSTQLNQAGWNVVGIARHPVDDFPGKLLLCDLTDAQQTREMLEKLLERTSIDAVVNNAGVASPQNLETLELETLQNVFDLNVRASVQIAQACLPSLKRSSAGRIVNVCSRAIFGARDRTAYAAAKSALVGVTRTWALELAPIGITVNAVAPGPIDTELFRKTDPWEVRVSVKYCPRFRCRDWERHQKWPR